MDEFDVGIGQIFILRDLTTLTTGPIGTDIILPIRGILSKLYAYSSAHTVKLAIGYSRLTLSEWFDQSNYYNN